MALGRSSLFSPSCEPIYAEYQAIHEEGKLLREDEASPGRWTAFMEDAENRIQPLQEKLRKECDANPSGSNKGYVMSFVGLRSEGEKTQAVRRPLMQLGDRLLGEIKTAKNAQKFEDSAIIKQLQVARDRMDRIGPAQKKNLDNSDDPGFDWVLWGIVLIDGVLLVAIFGPSIRRSFAD